MKVDWQYESSIVFCNLCNKRKLGGIGTSQNILKHESYFEICSVCLKEMWETYLHQIELTND